MTTQSMTAPNMTAQSETSNGARLLQQAQAWSQAGLIRKLDWMLAQFFYRQLPELTELELLAILLCSEANGRGHVCLDIAATLAQGTNQAQGSIQTQPGRSELWQQADAGLKQYLSAYRMQDWLQVLQGSSLVSCQLHDQQASSNAPLVLAGSAPFVLAGTAHQPLLYMRRYWQYEQLIGREITRRMQAVPELAVASVGALLQGLFPQHKRAMPFDWQMAACALALRSRFAIITGGPGTGKTTTVIKLLALLQGIQLTGQQKPLQILLAAPTGKAAARLNESIAQSLQQLDVSALPLPEPEQLKAWLPTQVQTVHRLLGARPDSRHFKHQRQNPLAADVVVVDEASMVDVELMAALVQALPANCRLYLLGDKDQLASVEAGSVLGDLCRFAEAGNYRPDIAAYLQDLCAARVPEQFVATEDAPALAQVTAMLRHSYRFKEGGAIHQLASLVNRGGTATEVEAAAAMDPSENARSAIAVIKAIAAKQDSPVQLLQQSMSTSVGAVARTTASTFAATSFGDALKALLLTGYRPYLTAVAEFDPAAEPVQRNQAALQILALQRDFQLLGAVREGDWGVQGLNTRIEQLLARHDLIKPQGQAWYPGRPVLMTRNDYHLQLMNGDIGVCLAMQEQDSMVLRVAFSDGEGGIRWVLPSRLHSVETVFAMTVHKSQGSEFGHTALLLPASSSPVLTRELLYTGITRAKTRFTLIYDNDAVLASTIAQRVQRASGFALV
ncbi:exodeoxyribonuclease V subunit alpha [Alkalimonas mucilaginosa]|uniref:RecBCD enzyme subunit RecD n=1 Tax=Alkalimonas mucilaginosa TaxID=3057676 RepID=A0ABU7JJJ1_9GAMM|nr:exodeoxyribonuclease V subunit alpha [Alkalimonas sp. MEB004]MEE2025854.1 exodeoxyribonuclease V subunit alpha [Alkalimonas sp. MEB004]